MFAGGAVAYGQGTPETPSEVDRIANSGNGGGQDVLFSRATEIIHPYGFSFDSAVVTGTTTGTPAPTGNGMSASYADLQKVTAWSRVFAERKNVGIAFMTCN